MAKNKNNPFGTHRVAKAGQKEMQKTMTKLQAREGLTWEQLTSLNSKQGAEGENQRKA